MRGNIPIPEIPQGEDLWLMVVITSVREKRTQQGKRFADATARNATGSLALKIWGETLEVWKDRLSLVQEDLLKQGVRRVRDLDPTAAEGWRALDDENLLLLDGVDIVFDAKELRRRIREGVRSGCESEHVKLAGVLFDGRSGGRAARIGLVAAARGDERGEDEGPHR